MNFLREVRHFLRFFWRTDPEVKRVVFYAEHAGYYPCFEGLVRELIDVHQVSLSYVTSDPHDPVLVTEHPRLHTFYIKSLLPYFMLLVKCRVFVMTLTDLNLFHLKRSLHSVHYVYIFHSMVSTHMMYRTGAFDHYDSILCVGPHHVAEIRAHERLHDLQAKQLIEAGYYRLERIHTQYQQQSDRPSTQDQPTTVLIAPSWGEHNLLKTCGSSLVDLLLKHDFRVIVRPHPETVGRDPALVKVLQNRFGDQRRFELELSVTTDDSLLAADVLICDLSGVALEYALGTERPVLFVNVPPKVHNEEYLGLDIEPIELALRDKIGQLVSPDNLEEVPAIVNKLLAEREAYRTRLAQLKRDFVFNFGRSSQIGAAHIRHLSGYDEAGPGDLTMKTTDDN